MALHRNQSVLSIVIPIAESSLALLPLIKALALDDCEILVVQAMETGNVAQVDEVRSKCQALGVIWLYSPASRGGQIALGVDYASANWLWVLHCDSADLEPALSYLLWLAKSGRVGGGRFDVRLIGAQRGLAWVARAMNWRSRIRRICTGDQGMFFHHSLLRQIGGFPNQPLMEDIEVSKRLRAYGEFFAPQVVLSTNGKRWEQHGVVRTVVAMWGWRLRYFLGVPARQLFDEYYGSGSKNP